MQTSSLPVELDIILYSNIEKFHLKCTWKLWAHRELIEKWKTWQICSSSHHSNKYNREEQKQKLHSLSRPDDLQLKWSEPNERRNPTIAWMELSIRLCISVSEKMCGQCFDTFQLSFPHPPSVHCVIVLRFGFITHEHQAHFEWTTEGLGYSVFDEFTTFRNSKFFNEILTHFHHPSFIHLFLLSDNIETANAYRNQKKHFFPGCCEQKRESLRKKWG